MAARDSIRENAYRVLALPGEATWKEIERSAMKLRRMDSWGAWSSPWDLPLLGPVRRDPESVDAAVARLEDPMQRFIDRLLWFHERDAEGAVGYLTAASIRDAREGWSSASLPVAKHDAAVVGLIATLTFDPDLEDLSLWRRVLREWRDALDRDDYWVEVLRVEMESGFLVPATLGEMRDQQEGALGHVAAVLLERGPGADGLTAARALTILRDELPSSIYERLCRDGDRVDRAAPAPAPSGVAPQDAPVDAPPDAADEAPNSPWPIPVQDPRDAPAKEPAPEASPTRTRSTMTAHMARLRANIAARPAPSARNGDPDAGAPSAEAPAAVAPIRLSRRQAPAEPGPQELTAPTPPPWHPDRRAPAVHITKAGAGSEPTPAEPAAASPDLPWATPEPAGTVEPHATPAPAAPAPATPLAATPPARRRRVRGLAIAVTLAAAVLAIVLVAPWQRTGGTAAPPAPAQPDPLRATLLARVDAADQAIAALLVERGDNREEQVFLRSTIEDYRELVADYDWRIANGLPYDPEGYRRVRGYLENDVARHQAAVDEARALADRYDALLRERARIVAQVNQLPR